MQYLFEIVSNTHPRVKFHLHLFRKKPDLKNLKVFVYTAYLLRQSRGIKVEENALEGVNLESFDHGGFGSKLKKVRISGLSNFDIENATRINYLI